MRFNINNLCGPAMIDVIIHASREISPERVPELHALGVRHTLHPSDAERRAEGLWTPPARLGLPSFLLLELSFQCQQDRRKAQ